MCKVPRFPFMRRDNCIAAVGSSEAAARGGNQGSTGMMTEQGLAYLVWREGRPYLAARAMRPWRLRSR